MLKFDIVMKGATEEHLGFIPYMLDTYDERSAAEQLQETYAHGGGWKPFHGFEMREDGSIKYAGDPAHKMIAKAQLRDEEIRFYDYSWLAIVQKDGSFEIARLD